MEASREIKRCLVSTIHDKMTVQGGVRGQYTTMPEVVVDYNSPTG
jgi:hypothetical protein